MRKISILDIFNIITVYGTMFVTAQIIGSKYYFGEDKFVILQQCIAFGAIYLIFRLFKPINPKKGMLLQNKVTYWRQKMIYRFKDHYDFFIPLMYIYMQVFSAIKLLNFKLRNFKILSFTPWMIFIAYLIRYTNDVVAGIALVNAVIMCPVIVFQFFLSLFRSGLKNARNYSSYNTSRPSSSTSSYYSSYNTSSSSSSTSSYYNGGTSRMENDDNYNQVENSEPKEEEPKKDLRVSDLNLVWSSKHGGSLEQAIAEDRNRDVVNFLEDMKREGYPISSNYAVDFVSEVTGRDKNYLLLDSVKRITRVSKDPVALNLIDMRYNELNRQGVGAARNFDRQLIKDAEQRIFGYH